MDGNTSLKLWYWIMAQAVKDVYIQTNKQYVYTYIKLAHCQKLGLVLNGKICIKLQQTILHTKRHSIYFEIVNINTSWSGVLPQYSVA